MLAKEIPERRQPNKDMYYFWDQLNLAQKYAVSELHRYGYELQFVRNIGTRRVAVLDIAGQFAAIDDNGQIDTKPHIILRP